MLAVEPALLYLIGDPKDPGEVWKKLESQFQKKSWANKLALRRKLHSLRLRDGESVQEHIKAMIELFNELSIVGENVEEEDRVVHLLASLPDSYSTLVTALEANKEVPRMDVVTERLLHTEKKLKEKPGRSLDLDGEGAMQVVQQRKGPRCHFCKKFGHIQRNCRAAHRRKPQDFQKRREHKPEVKVHVNGKNFSTVGLVACHVGTHHKRYNWIIDSGATCHISNNKNLFIELQSLSKPQEVTLGDGSTLKALGRGTVTLNLMLPDGNTKIGMLSDVLYVPALTYNLVSVIKATEMGKTVSFDKLRCQIIDEQEEVVAVAPKIGNLYFLDCTPSLPEVNTAVNESKEEIWHRRLGHLGEKSLYKLARNKLVDGFDYDVSKKIDFCEPCVQGKIHKLQFPGTGRKRAEEPLGLVHSDVCGKINALSLSGAEYFLTFIDDKTHYVWVYVLKNKHEVYQKFLEWKVLVERSSGYKLKTLRTDNGGEYTSTEFEDYLRKEGIIHEYTIPKTPQQNGVSERLNRTLVETVRSMLADSKLPQKFWAEALSTAVYLVNRSPTTTLEDMTPYEAWTGRKPSVNHLKVFGCSAYMHIPKDERKKLDPKANKCILLGYGAVRKGYRLYDQKCSHIIYSRDVIFNESVRGVEIEHEENRLIEVEEVKVESSLNESTPVEIEQNEENMEEPDTEGENVIEPDTEGENVIEPEIRRSNREIHCPDRYGVWIYNVNEQEREPMTVKEALDSSEKDKWRYAMQKEIESMHTNDVWDLVKLPRDRQVVGNKWVFKKKIGADGSVERYKARLVAQGFSQRQGLDYDETFSPVIRFESFRTLIAIAVQNGLKLHQLDITAAFLNGHLKEEVFMRQPEGFVVEGKENLVCKLKHSLYGLKQSPRCWNYILDNQLKSMGFVQSASDPCIYTAEKGEICIIGVYVDDIVLAGKSMKQINEVKKTLSNKFDVKDLGELNYFLGVQIIQDHKNDTVWIGQKTYTNSILKRFGMECAKSISTPVNTSVKLLKGTEDSEYFDREIYQSAVGSLLYLATKTRPDIAFAVGNVARYTNKPTRQHWTAIKRIFRYLRGTMNLGLLYVKSNSKNLIAYSDADWGGDQNDFRSTSGYIFQLGGTAISWRSKKHSSVALSTAESEYISLSETAQEAVWLRKLNMDLKNEQLEPTVIYEDNQSAICIAKNPQFHGRTKHIGIKHHFIREQVVNDKVELKYCKTEDMIADVFTKGLSPEKFVRLRRLCGMQPPNNSSASEKECWEKTTFD